MKVKPSTLAHMAELQRTYLAARFPDVLANIRSDPSAISTANLWTIWHHVTDESRTPDGETRFKDRARVLPFNWEFELYPDGTNDTTLETALKAAIKLV